MTDPIESLIETQPTRLADLFTLGKDSADLTPEELADSLDHLLTIPFETALSQMPPTLAAKLRDYAARLHVYASTEQAGVSTLGQLFEHPRPSIEALKFAKELGKAVQTHVETNWPRQVGAVIYYSSLAVALVRHGRTIGRLTDKELGEGFAKLKELPWLPDPIKCLFAEAQTKLPA